MTETQIDGRLVPIEPGPNTIVRFSGGRGGPSEAGDWEFWVAEGPAGAVAARCCAGADPGERFRRMQGSPADAGGWAIARVATRLRPATAQEAERWLDTHPDDTPFAATGEVGAMKVRVVNEGGRYRIVPEAP